MNILRLRLINSELKLNIRAECFYFAFCIITKGCKTSAIFFLIPEGIYKNMFFFAIYDGVFGQKQSCFKTFYRCFFMLQSKQVINFGIARYSSIVAYGFALLIRWLQK